MSEYASPATPLKLCGSPFLVKVDAISILGVYQISFILKYIAFHVFYLFLFAYLAIFMESGNILKRTVEHKTNSSSFGQAVLRSTSSSLRPKMRFAMVSHDEDKSLSPLLRKMKSDMVLSSEERLEMDIYSDNSDSTFLPSTTAPHPLDPSKF